MSAPRPYETDPFHPPALFTPRLKRSISLYIKKLKNYICKTIVSTNYDKTKAEVSEHPKHIYIYIYTVVPVWILRPFKDQKAADVLRKQLSNLSNRIGTPLQPISTSRKLGDALSVK